MELYVKGITIALKGVPMTVGVSLIAVALGIILGLGLALMKMSAHKALRIPAALYIDVVRGTPLIVQALLLAYGLPQVLQANEFLQSQGIVFRWPLLVIPAIIVCGLNSAAYVAEIIRGGIQAIDKGQMEAARSLGMSKSMAMRLIIIPQAFKVFLPSLGNEFVSLIKETAILSFVGVVEILRRGTLWNASSFETFPAYVGVAIVYMMLTIPLSKVIAHMEMKMKKGA